MHNPKYALLFRMIFEEAVLPTVSVNSIVGGGGVVGAYLEKD